MFARPRLNITKRTRTYRQHCEEMQSATIDTPSNGKETRHDSATDLSVFEEALEHQEGTADAAIEPSCTRDDTQRSLLPPMSITDIAVQLRQEDATEYSDEEGEEQDHSSLSPTSTQPHPPPTPSTPLTDRRISLASSSSRHSRRKPWTLPFDLFILRQQILHSDRLTEKLRDERPYLIDISHLERRLLALRPCDGQHSTTLLRLEACREELAGARRVMSLRRCG